MAHLKHPKTNMESSKDKFWRSVFRRVFTRYDEFRSVQGTNSCEPFYKMLEHGFGNGTNPKIIRVSPSDFIADVELAVKRALNQSEYLAFKKLYLDKDEQYEAEMIEMYGDEVNTRVKHRIQEKVGMELYAAKMFPPERYLKPKDIR